MKTSNSRRFEQVTCIRQMSEMLSEVNPCCLFPESLPDALSSTLSDHMKQWGLLDKGFAYDVVAVFGSQSTGKSE